MGWTVMESRLSLCCILALSIDRVWIACFSFVADDDDDGYDDMSLFCILTLSIGRVWVACFFFVADDDNDGCENGVCSNV
jgi:hypothetical protein